MLTFLFLFLGILFFIFVNIGPTESANLKTQLTQLRIFLQSNLSRKFPVIVHRKIRWEFQLFMDNQISNYHNKE